jgi:hypothetical protein
MGTTGDSKDYDQETRTMARSVRVCTDQEKLQQHCPSAVRLVRIEFGSDAWHNLLIVSRATALRMFRWMRSEGASMRAAYQATTYPDWHESYSGPGCYFAGRPCKRRNGRRWIVWQQRCGYDV